MIVLTSCKPEMSIENYFNNKMLEYDFTISQEVIDDELYVYLDSEFFCGTNYEDMYYELLDLNLNDYKPSSIDYIIGTCEENVVEMVYTSFYDYQLLVNDIIMYDDALPTPSEFEYYYNQRASYYEEHYCSSLSCDGLYDDEIKEDCMNYFGIVEDDYDTLYMMMDENE
jgi:hypothetical protein